MDILVGWHIDHTQKPSLTQQVSGKFGQSVTNIVHWLADGVGLLTEVWCYCHGSWHKTKISIWLHN